MVNGTNVFTIVAKVHICFSMLLEIFKMIKNIGDSFLLLTFLKVLENK